MFKKINLNVFNFSKFRSLSPLINNKYFSNKSTSLTPEEKSKSVNVISKKKFKILFFGNDDISLPTLMKIYEEMYKDESIVESLGVVTTPLENKKSFQAGFHKFLNDKKINKYELNVKTKENLKSSWRELVEDISEKKYDLGLVASFGKMIPGSVITSLNKGAYVMHPSLLPKYRGAAPIQHTLLNSEKKTGVSIVEASMGKFDAGDIILQREMNIENFHRFKELALMLSHMGADSTIEFIHNYDNLISNKKPQEESQVTKAGLILDNNYVYLDFKKKTNEEILTLYRAFFGSQLEPFTKAIIEGKERPIFFENLFNVTPTSEVFKLVLKKIDEIARPGDLYWDLKEDRNNIFFKTKNGWLVTNKIKLDCTPYTPGEKVISKIFKNNRFKTKENKQLAISTIPQKIQVVRPEKVDIPNSTQSNPAQ
jgi:methionyl-tRNA formyltransferase